MFNVKTKENIEEEPNFYISFTDIALSLLIVFILLTALIIGYHKQQTKYLEEGIEKFKIRENIAKILKEEFNNNKNIEVNEKTGVVTIANGKVEFIGDSDILIKPNITDQFLDEFIPKYINALKQEKKYYKYVKNIVIEGHTAKVNNDLDEMELSLKRAFVVYKRIYNKQDYYQINDVIPKIEAVGRGSQNLKNPNNIQAQENRRVEFHFILDEAKLIEDYYNSLKDINNENK